MWNLLIRQTPNYLLVTRFDICIAKYAKQIIYIAKNIMLANNLGGSKNTEASRYFFKTEI
jgi:hypothetical protein